MPMPPSTPAPAASAAVDASRAGLAAAFTGTIVSTYPDGRTARLWLSPGGVYTARGRRGDPSAGHWRLRADRLCLTQARPLPIPFSYCAPLVAGGVGAQWSGRAPTGEALRIALTPGRAGEVRP